ncbi:flagellar protein [Paenibacillus darwinianus]|uniref:Flagellar protein n=1 Tax=Paenibacillus darwinianus TaxID=1380763 RepID=A0A9W5W898_9BACL|nr:flagellar biosynthetic protein FliO [Paenibacillus darwinianus]EXX91339.1 flagellar protein [Paenibacillus darwinianus]EXX92302.1 flagellar protein [Paenibacillus darwinianus]EXX92839.1 flagellar protein [Paenibacillus darwinianus]
MSNYSVHLALSSLAFLTVMPSAVRAAGDTNGTMNNLDGPPAEIVGSTSMAGSLIWVIVSLILVIGLIVFVIKFLAGRSRIWGANRSLRSLGGVALGQNKSLQVVDVAGQLYVVGVGEDVRLLDKIEDPEQAQAIIRLLDQTSQLMWNTAAVGSLMNRLRNRTAVGGLRETETIEDDAFRTILQDKLQRQAETKHKVETLLNENSSKDRLRDE